MEAANLPTFLKFGKAKKSDICVIFAKSHGWPQNWGAGAKLGACAPRPGPKTTTGAQYFSFPCKRHPSVNLYLICSLKRYHLSQCRVY